MKTLKIAVYAAIVLLSSASCKKQLDVRNPNQPSHESANSEQGIINLAQGGVYKNGFINFGNPALSLQIHRLLFF